MQCVHQRIRTQKAKPTVQFMIRRNKQKNPNQSRPLRWERNPTRQASARIAGCASTLRCPLRKPTRTRSLAPRTRKDPVSRWATSPARTRKSDPIRSCRIPRLRKQQRSSEKAGGKEGEGGGPALYCSGTHLAIKNWIKISNMQI